MKTQPSLSIGSGIHYTNYIDIVANVFHDIANSERELFMTSGPDLFDIYLKSFPVAQRQAHNCHACRRFINTYGRLVTIDPVTGKTSSPLWGTVDAPAEYKKPVAKMLAEVKASPVRGVFRSTESQLGHRHTGCWSHYGATLPVELVFKHPLKTAHQEMAEKAQDAGTLSAALHEYSIDVINQAVTLLQSDALYRSEACLARAEWFRGIKIAAEANPTNRINIVWRAAASAPAGFSHIRSSMIGTLLDDLVSGMQFEQVARRFADKMAPTKYMRPVAPPTAGNIAQGEKIFEKLGLAPALRRRYAKIEEIELLWRAKKFEPREKASGGIFGHLIPVQAKTRDGMDMPPQVITLDKFLRTVLPTALGMEYKLRPADQYGALMAAVDPTAPNLFQWDNTFNWYTWPAGSYSSTWKLPPSGWHKVTGVTLAPSMWSNDLPHQGKSAMFLLEGAQETQLHGGLALFPSTLKSELHEVRATIEAFSKSGRAEGVNEGSANGIMVSANNNDWTCVVRVRNATGYAIYKIDRWD